MRSIFRLTRVFWFIMLRAKDPWSHGIDIDRIVRVEPAIRKSMKERRMTAEPHPFVLMIDDDADFLEVTEMAISQKGYATAVARNGRDGLRLFQQHNPHLVILDLGMPRMDGLETLQLIRQSSECPVIILTGNTSVGLFLQALDLGVHDYLIKGMSLQALTERVGMTLERLGCAEPYGCETGERADSSPC